MLPFCFVKPMMLSALLCAKAPLDRHRMNLSHTAVLQLPACLLLLLLLRATGGFAHPRVWWLARVTRMASVLRWGHEWRTARRRPRKAAWVRREAPRPAWAERWGPWWWPKPWEAWRIGSCRPWGPRVLRLLCWGWSWKGWALLLLGRPAADMG
jgi:hypothetical protein